jgi:hypothetical protein
MRISTQSFAMNAHRAALPAYWFLIMAALLVAATAAPLAMLTVPV